MFGWKYIISQQTKLYFQPQKFLQLTLGLCKNVPMRTGISSTTKNKRAEFVNSLIFDKVLFLLSFCKMCERIFNTEAQ